MADDSFSNSDDFFRDLENIYGQGQGSASDVEADAMLEGLNDEQRAAVTHLDGPLLILAGAGSGKTRVITYRIAYMMKKHNVAPSSILAITFTNKAANEMRLRIESLVGDRSKYIWCGTFHSIFAKILRRHAELLDYTGTFSILDSDDQLKLVKESMKELDIPDSQFKPKAVHSEISNAKNKFINVENYIIQAGKDYYLSTVGHIYKRYQEKLLANNSMDFDDILVNMVRLLEENPDICEMYRAKFRYILVDEYQDTNMPQYRAVMKLASGNNNICVVGDDDQSIYSFRGADVRLILKFEKDFPGARVIKLEENYRSTRTILDAANCVIANNTKRKSKHLRTSGSEGDKIILMSADSSQGEADFVGRTIKMMVDKGKFKYSDCAVLYRMNALSRNVETTLHNMGIPFKVYGGMRFYDRKEIKDILAYLRLINDPRDNIAFERIINVPKRGIGDTTIEKLRQIALSEDISMFDCAVHAADYPDIARASAKLTAFTGLINSMSDKLREGQMSFPEFVDFVENESGIIEEIAEIREKKGELIDRVENLKELLSEAEEFEKSHLAESVDMENLEIVSTEDVPVEIDDDFFFDTSTADTTAGILELYLQNAALFTEGDEYDENDDYVRLMSIHSSKGLEFGAVFLIGLEEGVFPSYRSNQAIEDTEEERRLMYVAITRAKKNLFMVLAKQRLLFGQTNCNKTSRFVKEINPDLLYVMGTKREVSKIEPSGETNREKSRKSIASALKTQFTGNNGSGGTREGQLGPNDISEGMAVMHPRFGEGIILKVEPVGGDALVSIDFDGNRKNMLVNSAGLRPL